MYIITCLIGDDMEMTSKQVYGSEMDAGIMEITQNKAYGQFGENIEMTPNQLYGLRMETNNTGSQKNEEENADTYYNITDTHCQASIESSYQYIF